MEYSFHDFHCGEIYYADLDPAFGHEQGGTRRTFKKPSQPIHVVLEDAEGLEPSLFMLEVIHTIDKRRVSGYVGELTGKQMGRIDTALRVSPRLNGDALLPIEMEAPSWTGLSSIRSSGTRYRR